MKIFKCPVVFAVTILLCLPPLAGCWDKRELTDLLFVSGIGVDLPESGDGLELSIEFIRLTSGKDDNITSSVFTTEVGDIGGALTDLATLAGGKENFNYCEAIVMSEEYARQGISEIVEMVMNNSEIQHTVLLAVSDGCKASEIFEAGGKHEPSAAYEISGIIKSNFKSCLSIIKNDAYKIRAGLQDPVRGSALTRLYLDEQEDEKEIMAGGAAVFGGDKFSGWLTPEEAAYFRMATGDAVGGYLSIPDAEGGYISAALRDFELNTRPSLDGLPAVEVRIGASVLPLRPPGSVEEERTDFKDAIEQGVRGVFERGRNELNCDIFGLAGAFGRKRGEKWASIEAEWDERFSELEFTVLADVKIEDTGLEK